MVATKKRSVLLLNKHWVALREISMARAMKYLTTEINGQPKARIIDVADLTTYTWADWEKMRPAEGEDAIVGTRLLYRVPKVIKLETYDKVPNYKVSFNRKTIFRRDNYTCQYCGKRFPTSELSIDHVTPKCQGGKSTWENCVLSCVKCNAKKADRTPEEARMVLLKKPQKPIGGFFKGETYCKTWQQFLDSAYWSVELQNDNPP